MWHLLVAFDDNPLHGNIKMHGFSFQSQLKKTQPGVNTAGGCLSSFQGSMNWYHQQVSYQKHDSMLNLSFSVDECVTVSATQQQ